MPGEELTQERDASARRGSRLLRRLVLAAVASVFVVVLAGSAASADYWPHGCSGAASCGDGGGSGHGKR